MKFRFARHTNNLETIKSFYIDILGGFEDHDGYDGIFIGKPNLDWHLEFTKSKELITFNFGEEDYLVFYPKTIQEFENIKAKLTKKKIILNTSKNPYWNENGMLVNDPDGYAIIICKVKI
ncbi:VOC family protein [Flavobacterium jejuense]|uniref:VOC family protein n=1 Tax=Flavobacterium jejuense TaxID=1544455 RepID=A0ABX0ITF2_9FLAO|nr:VOC family protein [Flavobacterium jejuense]NHN26811.1 VOC family protein [Flavobacterium jejuense]